MGCQHLDYRDRDGDVSFDTPRAYCTVTDQFVQPMRADICNERYDLDPAGHCEFYREHHDLDWDESAAGEGDDTGDREQSP